MGKVFFAIKVLQFLEVLLENFESEFFFTQQMAELLNQLNELFMICAEIFKVTAQTGVALDTCVTKYLEAYLAMVCILQEEDRFSQALLGDSETLKMVESLAASGDQLVSVYATVSKLM